MIYELRVYRVVQGRMAALLTRFEHQTLPIMVRHGILQVGFWTTIVGRSEQYLTYLLAWESLDSSQSYTSNVQPIFQPHTITDADVVSAVVLVSVSAGASARVAAEGSVARAALASDQNNRTYHRTYRAAD